MATSIEAAVETLRQINSTEPPVWLVPKQELSQAVRAASKHLFLSLKPHSPKSPFDQFLTEGFDAEQIWQQIDLQSQPLLSNLRREVKKFEKNPEEISKLKEAVEEGKKKKVLEEKETDDIDELDDDDDMDLDEEEDDDNDDGEEEEEEREGEEEGESEEEEEERELEGEENEGIEDKFLKIKELQEYLEEDEAREYGLKTKKKTKDEEDTEEEEEGDEEEDDDDDDEEEDELGLFDEDDEDNLGNARF